MSLIDRYVASVGRHLPEKDRADIEAEIRSMIEDTLEERGHNAGSADETVIVETLEELGDPRLLAFQYAPPRHYLIGPDWYEGYIKVLQRVLFTALPVFAAVTFILALTRDPMDFINALGEAAGGAFDVGMQIVFWVTWCSSCWNVRGKSRMLPPTLVRGRGRLPGCPKCLKDARSALSRT